MNLCHRPARVRPASFRRDAYYTQRGGLYDLQDTSEITTKSWLRTLVVLGDQNRSQTIDRHASGLRAPGETRATHNLITRVRRTLRQSAPQKRSLPPLRKNPQRHAWGLRAP